MFIEKLKKHKQQKNPNKPDFFPIVTAGFHHLIMEHEFTHNEHEVYYPVALILDQIEIPPILLFDFNS